MPMPSKILQAAFYTSVGGNRPVREWLMALSRADRKTIGEDIATLEFCWPIGKPRCSAMKGTKGLWEVRCNISSGRIARVIFMLLGDRMILLHGFVKKTRKTPAKDLTLAIARMKEVRNHE